jgi:hypothetical protein
MMLAQRPVSMRSGCTSSANLGRTGRVVRCPPWGGRRQSTGKNEASQKLNHRGAGLAHVWRRARASSAMRLAESTASCETPSAFSASLSMCTRCPTSRRYGPARPPSPAVPVPPVPPAYLFPPTCGFPSHSPCLGPPSGIGGGFLSALPPNSADRSSSCNDLSARRFPRRTSNASACSPCSARTEPSRAAVGLSSASASKTSASAPCSPSSGKASK